MIEAISTSNTGLNASQTLLDVTSNNLANLNTTGFKANGVGFQDLLYGAASASGASSAGGIPLGRGVVTASTDKSFAQGPLQSTGAPLDVAIQGNGFFQVARPDGSIAYTRDGTFHIDGAGRLVTSDGSLVQPPIVVPTGATSINIGMDGTVTATVAGTPESVRVLGQLNLVLFPNSPGLTALGNNQFAASAASGSAAPAVPGQGGAGTLVQGFLEGSNVSAATELVNLLIAERTFAANSQVIVAANQMLTDTVNLIA